MSFYQLDFQDKKYWTHSSFMSEENNNKITEIKQGVNPVRNGFTFAAFYASIFFVNKVNFLARLPLPQRAAAVLVPTLLTRMVIPWVYNSGQQSSINRLLDGAPLWENKFDVPELDKLYFFLDDDTNYKPNLMHHSSTAPIKYQAVYRH